MVKLRQVTPEGHFLDGLVEPINEVVFNMLLLLLPNFSLVLPARVKGGGATLLKANKVSVEASVCKLRSGVRTAAEAG